MLAISIIAVGLALSASFLSRSALAWTGLLAISLLGGVIISASELYWLLIPLDVCLLMAMIGMRQAMNRTWQPAVVVIQIMLCVIYTTFAVFSEKAPWIISPTIDTANTLFLLQALAVTTGGALNSYRVWRLIQSKDIGTTSLLTAWRMMR